MAAKERLQELRRQLRELFIERDHVVDGVLIALLARQHVLLLGPPGTAKSMLAKEVCRRLERKTHFEWLLTKFTTPEEILGPVSLVALEEGRYERVTTGKLPEAHVAFLDEVFKASSAILNALLTILNERQFHQGTRVLDVPLETLIGASNELPEEDELGALYDRFLLRFQVGYIEQDHRFARLLALEAEPVSELVGLSSADLAVLQAEVKTVSIPNGIFSDLIELRRKLNHEGVVASDRRYRASVGLLRASALLEGRTEVTPGDLRWLEHVLWSDPEERPKVQAALAQIASGFEEEARKLVFQAKEIEAYAARRWPDEDAQSRAVLEAHTKLHDIIRRLEAMKLASRQRGRETSRLDEIVEEVSAMQMKLFATQN